MIATITPSRGLIYSKTVESLFNGTRFLNENGLATKSYFSHDLPIPDCFNYLVGQALQDGAKVIIIIEEDMYLFPKSYLSLAQSDSDVATMQYNDKNGSPHGIIHYNEAGDILWGGLGATAIKRHVFEKLGEPYFTTENRYKITKKHFKGEQMVTEYEPIEPRKIWDEDQNKFIEKKDHYKYGGQDIDFYTRARHAGFTIGLIKNEKAHHFDLVQLGENHINHGCHIIKQV